MPSSHHHHQPGFQLSPPDSSVASSAGTSPGLGFPIDVAGSLSGSGGSLLMTKHRGASTDSLSAMVLSRIEPVSEIPMSVEERILDLLMKHPDGVLGSDIPRFFTDAYGERLIVPENKATNERPKLKDFLLSLPGVVTYTRNTQPVFMVSPNLSGDADVDDHHDTPVVLPPVNHTQVQFRLLNLLHEASKVSTAGQPGGILGAQLPSKYLETFGEPLRLETRQGEKLKLKEYLLGDELTLLLKKQTPPLRMFLIKAGHDRRYSIVPEGIGPDVMA